MKDLGILRNVINVFRTHRDIDQKVAGQLLARFPDGDQRVIMASKLTEQTRVELLTELQDSLDPLKGEFDLLAEYNKEDKAIYPETGN